MSYLFDLRKKMLQKEIEHNKILAKQAKIQFERQYEIDRLKVSAEKAKYSGLSKSEKNSLKELEEKKKEISRQRIESFRNNLKSVELGIGNAARRFYASCTKPMPARRKRKRR